MHPSIIFLITLYALSKLVFNISLSLNSLRASCLSITLLYEIFDILVGYTLSNTSSAHLTRPGRYFSLIFFTIDI